MCFPSVQEVGQGFECSILRNEMAEDSENKKGRSCAKFWRTVRLKGEQNRCGWDREGKSWAVRRYCGVATSCDSGIMASTAVDLPTTRSSFPSSLFLYPEYGFLPSTRTSLVVTLMSRAIYLKIDIISIITSPPAFTSFCLPLTVLTFYYLKAYVCTVKYGVKSVYVQLSTV